LRPASICLARIAPNHFAGFVWELLRMVAGLVENGMNTVAKLLKLKSLAEC